MPRDNGAVIVELGGKMTSLPQNGTCLPQSDQLQTMNAPIPQELTMTMSQNGTTLAQNGSTVSQNGMTTSNEMTLPQNGTAMAENGMTASPVTDGIEDVLMADVVMDSHEANHGSAKSTQFLPVEGGYILVEENEIPGIYLKVLI